MSFLVEPKLLKRGQSAVRSVKRNASLVKTFITFAFYSLSCYKSYQIFNKYICLLFQQVQSDSCSQETLSIAEITGH